MHGSVELVHIGVIKYTVHLEFFHIGMIRCTFMIIPFFVSTRYSIDLIIVLSVVSLCNLSCKGMQTILVAISQNVANVS